MKKIIFSLVLALGSMSAAQALTGDADAGKIKAASCASCHGALGISAVGAFPNLAGQNDVYIINQLKSFKSGARANMMMMSMAANLSEQDMADIAAFYTALSWNGEVAETVTEETIAPTASIVEAEVVEIVSSTPASAIYPGDVQAGKEKSLMCASCHGATGISAINIYPNLAGQSANYLSKQLANFKSGERENAMMAGIAAALSTEDMDDLASYFAVQSAKVGSGDINEAGHKLYIGGDAAKGVSACIACHGVNGKGMKQAGFPSLAGQNKEYVKQQLISFRAMTRGNDNNGMMRNIAIKLSDADIDALSEYTSSLK